MIKRYEALIKRSLKQVRSGMTYRAAGVRNRIPKFTLWNRAQRARRTNVPACRTAFSAAEELQIVELIQKFLNKGLTLNRRHLLEAAGALLGHYSKEED